MNAILRIFTIKKRRWDAPLVVHLNFHLQRLFMKKKVSGGVCMCRQKCCIIIWFLRTLMIYLTQNVLQISIRVRHRYDRKFLSSLFLRICLQPFYLCSPNCTFDFFPFTSDKKLMQSNKSIREEHLDAHGQCTIWHTESTSECSCKIYYCCCCCLET